MTVNYKITAQGIREPLRRMFEKKLSANIIVKHYNTVHIFQCSIQLIESTKGASLTPSNITWNKHSSLLPPHFFIFLRSYFDSRVKSVYVSTASCVARPSGPRVAADEQPTGCHQAAVSVCASSLAWRVPARTSGVIYFLRSNAHVLGTCKCCTRLVDVCG